MQWLVGIPDNIPGLDEMYYGEESPKEDADASDSHICNAEEGVLAPHHSSGGYDHRFRASIHGDQKI